MNILIFNWRDIKNPSAGGSELYFHELAKRWVRLGNKVTVICGGWKNCKRQENIDGINIIRAGNALTLYLYAPIAYFKLKERPDVIIDVENGIPFFTPLFARAKRILHIHHVHREVWFKELNPIAASVGWIIETKIMPLFYKKSPIITISNSSRSEILDEGFKNVIGVVNPGMIFSRYRKFEKNKSPAILFLNRIKKYKGLDILLKAVNELEKQEITPEVWIAGSGDYLKTMRNYAERNNLTNVRFFGRVSQSKKQELMQRAWVFVNPSSKEGWGIVNIEANYYGTPVIGSNVSGIKDSVVNGKTGLIFKHGHYRELADQIRKLIENNRLRAALTSYSRKWAKSFDYDIKAKEYLKLIEKVALSS